MAKFSFTIPVNIAHDYFLKNYQTLNYDAFFVDHPVDKSIVYTNLMALWCYGKSQCAVCAYITTLLVVCD